MQTPKQVLDTYFLDIRNHLLEIAAMFDRYDAAMARAGLDSAKDLQSVPESLKGDDRFRLLWSAACILADENQKDRAETLLNLFSDLDDETQEGKDRTHPF